MKLKNKFAALAAFVLAASMTSCGGKDSSSSSSSPASDAETTVAEETSAEETTEEPTEEVTEELVPPVPAEASDPNTVTFDDGNFDFAYIQDSDNDSAQGTLSVVEVQGNKMLKFNDDFTVPLNGKVQKVVIDPVPLIGAENLSKVKSIELDTYADALEQEYNDASGELLKVPGTICGGGGTVTAKKNAEGKGQWYDFDAFEGGEYNFEMSGPIHATFKFLLSASGLAWEDNMDEVKLQIMRWGSENVSNFYVDNIVFYDEDGNSIPLITGGASAEGSGEETDAPEETSEGAETEETSEEAAE